MPRSGSQPPSERLFASHVPGRDVRLRTRRLLLTAARPSPAHPRHEPTEASSRLYLSDKHVLCTRPNLDKSHLKTAHLLTKPTDIVSEGACHEGDRFTSVPDSNRRRITSRRNSSLCPGVHHEKHHWWPSVARHSSSCGILEFREFAALAQIDLSALERFSGDHTPTDEEVRQLLRPGGPLSYRRVLRFRRLIVDQWQAREGVRLCRKTLALARTFPIFNAMDDVPRRERILLHRGRREKRGRHWRDPQHRCHSSRRTCGGGSKARRASSASDVKAFTTGATPPRGIAEASQRHGPRQPAQPAPEHRGSQRTPLESDAYQRDQCFTCEPNSDQPFAHLRDIHGIQIEAPAATAGPSSPPGTNTAPCNAV